MYELRLHENGTPEWALRMTAFPECMFSWHASGSSLHFSHEIHAHVDRDFRFFSQVIAHDRRFVISEM